jgi:molybdopterin converting factor small subunit
MRVEVLFFGNHRELAGTAREIITLKAETRLSGLFNRLGDRHGDELRRELANKENLTVLVNGRHYGTLDGVETILKNKDTVAILPVIFGG